MDMNILTAKRQALHRCHPEQNYDFLEDGSKE
jgi:hypothetical protein